jgi:ubiquinone/menaquinone biosynthesis C-methylase UbiE
VNLDQRTGVVAFRLALLLALLLAGASASFAAPPPEETDAATSRHSFEDVPHWKAVFDDPERDRWQQPEKVVQALRLRQGMVVADLGAGTGYFSRHLASAVGPRGSVLAVDTEPNMVVQLRTRAEQELTSNVIPILASRDNPRLPTGSVDVVLVVDTYHHIDDRVTYFRTLRHALRRGGRVAVVEWQHRELPVGPPLAHKLPRRRVIREMDAAGYAVVAEPAFLAYQYFIIFEPR